MSADMLPHEFAAAGADCRHCRMPWSRVGPEECPGRLRAALNGFAATEPVSPADEFAALARCFEANGKHWESFAQRKRADGQERLASKAQVRAEVWFEAQRLTEQGGASDV